MAATKPTKTSKVEPKDITSFRKGLYKGLNISKIATRPGSMDVLKSPSRIVNTLFYPDGTIVKEKAE